MERTGLSRAKIINEVLKIGHGDLNVFKDVCLEAVRQDSEMFAHLIAWNHKVGRVMDSKKAFPVMALRDDHGFFYENAVAHMCLLDPKDFLASARWHMQLHKTGCRAKQEARRFVDKAAKRYIREREASVGWFDRTVLQHRRSMKALYRIFSVKPSGRAQAVLFNGERPSGSIFEKVVALKTMGPKEAAGTIIQYRIPFLIAVGAIGGIKDKPDVVIALVEQMSRSELVTNTKMLERFGAFDNPAIKAAYEKGMADVKREKRPTSALKAGKAAQHVSSNKVAHKLQAVQEEQLDTQKSIPGDGLILGDKSGSMEHSIEVTREVAGLIARKAEGKVALVFFDSAPRSYDVTGKTLDQINAMTRAIGAGGGTAIGCGLEMAREKGQAVDWIVVVSDGGDGGGNCRPLFHDAYKKYVDKMGIEPTVYMIHVPGDQNMMAQYCKSFGIEINMYEMGSKSDMYALPQIVNAIRPGHYALYDEIMAVPLLTFDEAFARKP